MNFLNIYHNIILEVFNAVLVFYFVYLFVYSKCIQILNLFAYLYHALFHGT